MKYLALLLLLFATPCFASTQILVGGNGVSSSIIGALGLNIVGTCAGTQVCGLAAAPGTMANIKLYVTTVPTGSTSWVATLEDNGSPTTVTCTINSSSGQVNGLYMCTDSTHSASITAGHYYYINVTNTGGAPAAFGYASIQFTPTTANQNLIFAGGVITSATSKFTQSFGNAVNTTQSAAQNIFPEAGVLSNIYIALTTTPGGSTVDTLSLMKNQVADVNVNCQVGSANTTCNATSVSTTTDNNATNNADVFGTQSVLASGTGANSSGGIGNVWTSNTAGDYPLLGSTSGAFSTSATNYVPCSGSAATTQTESAAQVVMDASTVSNLSAHTRTATGANKSWIVTVNKNGTPTSETCTIGGTITGTSCTMTGTLTFAAGDLCDISWAPVSTPTATTMGQTAMAAQFVSSTVITNIQDTFLGGIFKLLQGMRTII